MIVAGWAWLSRRIAYAFLVFVGAILLLSPVPTLGLLWDVSMLCGFSALFVLLQMFALTGRPLSTPFYEGKFFIRLHEYGAYMLLAFVAWHIGFSLWAEPQLLEDLLPPITGVMQTGVVAATLLAIATFASLPPVRRAAFGTATLFRRSHSVCATLLLCASGAHAWLAGLRLAGFWPSVAFAALAGGAVALPWASRQAVRPHRPPGKRARDTARFAAPVAMVMLSLGVALPFLGAALLHWRAW
ncbi:ferric reductase-like transmembrane domain-containing protein [Acetobacter nitrogenifigens]|uniref:Ferric oxidoreductase domain-containing protein n=2 Tax=Acetobacter nitrogenifigens TaxID=285268 RepID=A0A511XE60_9PROT|nr:ferric reductase-like transmembrane domain-containing protein [Acetobacter nitrogenifigens]GEN61240.1 hypothetical protein ANI02nite_31240 [Acetobacter nitrogenifigens DSM 23921 = NBRC 105050]